MNKLKVFLLLVLLPMTFKVFAENGCPEGMIPYSGTDISSCGPIPPNYYQGNQRAAPLIQWESKWGALASDKFGHIAGVSNDLDSKEQAEQSAIEDCKRYGGVECKPDAYYSNQCIAVVSGDNRSDSITNSSIDAAMSEGMHRCTARGDTNCHVFYSACSLPRRIQ